MRGTGVETRHPEPSKPDKRGPESEIAGGGAPRGVRRVAQSRRAAAWLGDALRERKTAPELILCSPAARTRETLRLADVHGSVRFEPAIYGQRDGDYLDVLREAGGTANSPLLLAGHNSATARTAALLVEGGSALEFPTAAFAIIDLAIDDWHDLRTGQGTLVDYCAPPKD